jgi:hypothetical protein
MVVYYSFSNELYFMSRLYLLCDFVRARSSNVKIGEDESNESVRGQ